MDVFRKTIKYSLYKLADGGINLGVSALLFIILFAIGRALKADEVTAVLMLLWVILSAGLSYLFIGRLGCALRVGHLAVMCEYILTDELPTDNKSYGKSLYSFGDQKLRLRFPSLTEAQSCEHAVRAAIGELQTAFSRFDSPASEKARPDKTPQIFTDIALGYISQSCLGYAFYNELVNCRRAAAEGILVYSRNQRKLLKNAFSVALTVIITTAAAAVLSFLLLWMLFAAIPATKDYALFPSAVLAVLFALAIKFAFTDSFLLSSVYRRYISLAQYAEITTDAYGRLCSTSRKYRSLYQSAQKLPDPEVNLPDASDHQPPVKEYDENALRKYTGEIPVVTARQGQTKPSARKNPAPPRYTANRQPTRTRTGSGAIFCPECGTKNDFSSKFCQNCGTPLGR